MRASRDRPRASLPRLATLEAALRDREIICRRAALDPCARRGGARRFRARGEAPAGAHPGDQRRTGAVAEAHRQCARADRDACAPARRRRAPISPRSPIFRPRSSSGARKLLDAIAAAEREREQGGRRSRDRRDRAEATGEGVARGAGAAGRSAREPCAGPRRGSNRRASAAPSARTRSASSSTARRRPAFRSPR